MSIKHNNNNKNMSIIEKLKVLAAMDVSSIGKKKPDTSSSKQASKSKQKPKPKSKLAKTSTSNPAQPKRKVTEIKVIENRKEIPGYVLCLSLEGGEFPLNEEQRDKYIILQKKEGGDVLYLLCSDETMTGGMDQDYLSIRERCQSKGYKVDRQFALRSIIGILYEIEDNKANNHAEDFRNSKGLQREYDAILLDAARDNISDLHFEIRRSTAMIRQRKDGQLVDREPLPVQKARKMASVIYQVIAEEKDTTFNEQIPQDAVIDRELDGTRIRVRLATIPAYPEGFDMIMRILPMGIEGKIKTLSTLGYMPEQVKLISKAISQPQGVTILCGTTGSGKSTSLSTMLSEKIKHYNGRIKVISIEDPPEYVIAGSTQVPVVRSKNAKKGENPFAAAIRASMRSDPDILNIGEVRDEDSAELLVMAAQSGHQAFTTLHAPSAIGIAGRLRGLGVADDVLGSKDFFSGLIYQTLLPVNCEDCSLTMEQVLNSKEGETYKDVVGRISNVLSSSSQSHVRFRNHDGCDKCTKGVTGRTVVAEVIVPDAKMCELIGQSKDTDAYKYYVRELGGRSVLQYGIDLVESGRSCPLEAEHKLGLLDEEKRMELVTTDCPEAEPDAISVDSETGTDDIRGVPSEAESVDGTTLNSALLGEEKFASSNVVSLGNNNDNN